MIKHKSGASNKVVDASIRRILLLTSMIVTVEGFDSVKDLYPIDPF